MNSLRNVIHVGNILNNGYLNCKFLRRFGFEADCLNLDYPNSQGAPEWEDVDFGDASVPEWEPDWSAYDIGGYQRPDWFFDLMSADLPRFVMQLDQGGAAEAGHGATPLWWDRVRNSQKLQRLMQQERKRMARLLGVTPDDRRRQEAAQTYKACWSYERAFDGAAVQNYTRWFPQKEAPYSGQEWLELHRNYFDSLLHDFAEVFPERETPLSEADLLEWMERSILCHALVSRYRLVEAYSLFPILPLLGAPDKPYICFEHGTLREFPFQDSVNGRLYAMSLLKSEKVVITNCDCIHAANRLGLDNFVFIPHPVDEQVYTGGTSELRAQLIEEHDCDVILVSPSRHHWKDADPSLRESWFKRNDVAIRGLGRLKKAHPELRFLIIFFEWGQEVEESKELIRECGLEKHVRWEPLSCKRRLKRFYNASDIVVDQFGHGAVGTTAMEGLASGKPVLVHFNPAHHEWCFTEMPPFVSAWDVPSFEEGALPLLRDASLRTEVGEKGRSWFQRFHSSKIVAKRHFEIYQEISDKHGFGWDLL